MGWGWEIRSDHISVINHDTGKRYRITIKEILSLSDDDYTKLRTAFFEPSSVISAYLETGHTDEGYALLFKEATYSREGTK